MGLGGVRPVRAAWRVLRLMSFGITPICLVWTLLYNPFAQPSVDRSIASLSQTLDRALARQVTPDWLGRELDAALDAGDWGRVETLTLIGADQGLTPSPETSARIEILQTEKTGTWATVRDCARCMADVMDCPTVAMIAACAVPFELTPAGDLNSLRRAGVAAASGDDIDEIDVALSVFGLGATAASGVSGGTSVTIKAGTTVLRLGRRLGTLTPAFQRTLGQLLDINLQPSMITDWLAGRVTLDAVVDTGRVAAFGQVAGDLATVARHTSLGEAVVLLQYVDSPSDAARLARVSEAAGPNTRAILETLGKQRVLRTTIRLTTLALTAVALLALMILQVLVLLGGAAGEATLRRLTRAMSRHRNRPEHRAGSDG